MEDKTHLKFKKTILSVLSVMKIMEKGTLGNKCSLCKQNQAEVSCPICKKPLCLECSKVLDEKENIFKLICKGCYKRYLIRAVSFWLSIILLLLLPLEIVSW